MLSDNFLNKILGGSGGSQDTISNAQAQAKRMEQAAINKLAVTQQQDKQDVLNYMKPWLVAFMALGIIWWALRD